MKKLTKAITLIFVTIYIFLAILSNWNTPPTNHLFLSVSNEGMNSSTFLDYFLFKQTSRFIFKNKITNPRPCDTVLVTNNGDITQENNSLIVLESLYGKPGIDNDGVFDMLDFLVKQCDVNAPSEGDLNLPLHIAVADKHLDLVRFFIMHGAKVEVTINRPGRPTHGMSAVQFARWLEEHASSRQEADEYSKILAELERAHLKYIGGS